MSPFHALAHFAFAMLCLAYGVLLGIGVGCDVRRWLRDREARKQALQDGSQTLRVIRGDHD